MRLLLLISLSVSFAVLVSGDFLKNDYELMDNDTTVEMVSLDISQYCFVDENTIRINLNTTRLLNIINSSEDVIMATAVVNNNDDAVIFIAPSNASSCTDNNNEDDKLYMSTTLYVIQMIIHSTISLVAISNITLHLLIKDLHTITGILLMLLCTSVIIVYIVAMGNLTNAYTNRIVVLEIILENIIFFMLIVYQAIKLIILYHFAYLMYQSYKLISEKDENVKSKLFKYIMFIIGSSTICYLLPLLIDFAVNGRIYHDTETSPTYRLMLYIEFGIIVALEYLIFSIGLTMYFLVNKSCCEIKSTNLRVTMLLITTVGIATTLIAFLKHRVPEEILIPAVTGSTLIDQIILLTMFLSSAKVIGRTASVCTNQMCAKKTTQSTQV